MQVNALLLWKKLNLGDLLRAEEACEIDFFSRCTDDLENLAQLVILELLAALFRRAVARDRRKWVTRCPREQWLPVMVVLDVIFHHIEKLSEDAAE